MHVHSLEMWRTGRHFFKVLGLIIQNVNFEINCMHYTVISKIKIFSIFFCHYLFPLKLSSKFGAQEIEHLYNLVQYLLKIILRSMGLKFLDTVSLPL